VSQKTTDSDFLDRMKVKPYEQSQACSNVFDTG